MSFCARATMRAIAEEIKQKQFRGSMGLGESNGKSTDTVWSTNMGEEAKELDQAMSGYFPPVDSYIPGEEQDQAPCADACPIRKPPYKHFCSLKC